jgi:hypothetical protein
LCFLSHKLIHIVVLENNLCNFYSFLLYLNLSGNCPIEIILYREKAVKHEFE